MRSLEAAGIIKSKTKPSNQRIAELPKDLDKEFVVLSKPHHSRHNASSYVSPIELDKTVNIFAKDKATKQLPDGTEPTV